MSHTFKQTNTQNTGQKICLFSSLPNTQNMLLSLKHANACLFYKIVNGLTSPPLRQFINIRTTATRVTRGAERGDCIIPLRKSSFSQSSFSVKAAQQWNSIPSPIRYQTTFSLFNPKLKIWLVRNPLCQH